jgi:hypothetical protein
MRRKQFFLWLGLLVVVIGILGASLMSVLYHEPDFYHRAAIAPVELRKTVSGKLLLNIAGLSEYFTDRHTPTKDERENGWTWSVKEEDLNSYFEVGFKMWGDEEALRKRGISDPRICIEPDRIRLAFRYGSMPWSTLISLDFRLWVVPGELNVVALEILNRRAGGLPISAQFFFDQVTEIARKSNIEVAWYRNKGNPVALFRFQSSHLRPSAKLKSIDMRPGVLYIRGSPVEAAPIAFNEPRLPTFNKVRPARENQLALAMNATEVARLPFRVAASRVSSDAIVHTSIYRLPAALEE